MFRQGLGSAQDLRLGLDDLLHLHGHLGNLQPPHQVLAFHQQPDNNFAALVASGREDLRALVGTGRFGLLQQPNHLGHLGVHQRVEALAHAADVCVELARGHPVFLELLKLDVEHRADQFAGHGADLLLNLLLPPEALGLERLGVQRRSAGHDDQPAEYQCRHVSHGDSPMPS